MPCVTTGPLAGNYLPDYDGGSTINLLSSIIRAHGGTSPHAELEGLPASALKDAPCIVYLVLDGLGLAQLRTHLGQGLGEQFFARHEHRAMTTVFPATTAAAVTTFDTGTSPTEHAILSWFLNLPDLGCVSTVLRTHTRVGTPLAPPDFDLREYFAVPSHLETVKSRRALLSWGPIPDVPFAVVGTRWEDRRSYPDLNGMVETIDAFGHEAGRRLAYAYWPRYDGLCHEEGCDSKAVVEHFEAMDRALGGLVRRLEGTGTLLCVLADHGLVDVEKEHCVDLAAVPGLVDCFATAPAGDQRQMSCFVRPSKVDRFLDIVNTELSEVCTCIEGRTLIDTGAFGPGTAHPAFEMRLGDYVLLCKDDRALIYTPRGTEPLYMRGSHGGMSATEIQIPLYVVRCP